VNLWIKIVRLLVGVRLLMANETSLEFERKYKNLGYEYIIGVDEVGAGSLAGPLVVAAVCIPDGFDITNIKDSKKIAPKKRERIATYIMDNCEFSIYEVDNLLIDSINIRNAREVGMRAVINNMENADLALIDGNFVPLLLNTHGVSIINGDNISASIAAASIVAKVYRDNLMTTLGLKYTMYNWAKNKGYGTKEHREALKKYGPCEFHRKSFKLL